MSPTRYSSLFRNRWLALMWAAGICWGAVEFAGSTDIGSDPTTNAATATAQDDAADLNTLQTLVGRLEH